ncbi:ANK_REP_REGION domain-containing protein [Durusdinium trenchii]|uniref:ANK_REP_REGION domain-containing protein n=1 Tax=Durusdinium trenchii TaxID=1381693 RepID=A0ABP0L3C3_9DINO
MSEQLVTGSAIHLAASRGHRWLVEMLLDRGASIESMVQRDGLPYDNVIHVAVWKEGRGGDKDMISFLCARGSDIASTRADGGSCLHVAFMTGNEATIRAVQDQMEEDGCNTHEFLYDDSSSAERTETPLELGIKAGKLSQEALAALAPPHLSSLRVFIHHAPECIPSFMVRLMRAESDRGVTVSGGVADVLFDKLSSLDIARLILDFPEAFASLLNVCTTRPAVVCPGWHPLPQRMSFAGQHVFTRMYVWLFGVPSFVTFYVQDTQWEFNDATYSAPAWHQQITAQKSAPYKDVKIQVCRLPNIISPKVFAPLVRSADQGQFLHLVPAIRAAVSHTFWNGAVWMEVSQFILALWGLILLVIETLHKHEAAMAAMGSDREMTEEAFDPSYAADSLTHGVVADWIIAKGIVDLLLELVQIWGCDLVGELRSYATLGNIWDLSRSIIPILPLVLHGHRCLRLLVVLIYWARLLEGLTLSEAMGHALVPLQKLLKGLLPALVFTMLSFAALTHAMLTVQLEATRLWPQTLFMTFTTFLSQGLPEDSPSDSLELLVLCGGILFFSIFVLNIFVGVINDRYQFERERAALSFANLRASSCLTYLFRVCVLPCQIVNGFVGSVVAVVCIVLMFCQQVMALVYGKQLPGYLQLVALLGCQVTLSIAALSIAAFQCMGSADDTIVSDLMEAQKDGYIVAYPCKRYLWICETREGHIQSSSSTGGQTDSILQGDLPGGEMLDEQLDTYMMAIREVIREEFQVLQDRKDCFDHSPRPTLLTGPRRRFPFRSKQRSVV